jgi:hypothetical protein
VAVGYFWCVCSNREPGKALSKRRPGRMSTSLTRGQCSMISQLLAIAPCTTATLICTQCCLNPVLPNNIVPLNQVSSAFEAIESPIGSSWAGGGSGRAISIGRDGMLMVDGCITPALGLVWSHCVNTRLLFVYTFHHIQLDTMRCGVV